MPDELFEEKEETFPTEEPIVVPVPAPQSPFERGTPLPRISKRPGPLPQQVDRDNGQNTTDSNRFRQT